MDRDHVHGFWSKLSRPISALAPMEDVTDSVFRRVLLEAGRPDVFFTEFTNVAGLCSEGREAVIHRLDYTDEEHPIVAQIWGTDPDGFYAVARELRGMGFDGIDINMGCPVKKIVKTGSCSALIDNPSLAAELIRATKEGAGTVPVSVKTRLGFRSRKTEEWTRFLLEQKPAVLTMHGRVAKDMSDVPADWDEVGRVVRIRNEMKSRTLIIGNGDISSQREIGAMHERYGVDGVMVGRGVFRNLFLFRRPAGGTPEYAELSPAEKIRYYREHVGLYRDTWGDDRNFNIMKKFAKVYVAGFPGAATLRNEVMEAHSYAEMLETLEESSRVLTPTS